MFQVNESTFTLPDVFGEGYTTSEVLLTLYNVFVIVAGVGGNIVVLIGSLRYRALQMDSGSVILLNHIAVADLTAVITWYVPKLVTLLAQRWVLGTFMCLTWAIRGIPLNCEVWFITILACNKLYTLYRPLQGGLSSRATHYITVVVWVCCTISVVTQPLVLQNAASYQPAGLECMWQDTPDTPEYAGLWFMVGWTLHVALPVVITVLANVAMLCRVRNVGRKAMTTVSIICWVFLCSYVPVFITAMIGTDILSVLAVYLITLNMIVNPVIYSFSNKKFKFFLKKLCRCDLKQFQIKWNRSQKPALVFVPTPRASETRM